QQAVLRGRRYIVRGSQVRLRHKETDHVEQDDTGACVDNYRHRDERSSFGWPLRSRAIPMSRPLLIALASTTDISWSVGGGGTRSLVSRRTQVQAKGGIRRVPNLSLGEQHKCGSSIVPVHRQL